MADGPPATLLTRKEVFAGRVVRLVVERVELPNGRVSEVEIIRHVGAAAVVALTAADEVLLVRQYRHATGEWLLEVPAGKLDGTEEPAICAARELAEETGFAASDLTELGWIWTTPGFTDERIWLFLARGLEAGTQALEDHEVLSVVRMPLAEAVAAVHSGRIRDAKSMCALLRAHCFLSS